MLLRRSLGIAVRHPCSLNSASLRCGVQLASRSLLCFSNNACICDQPCTSQSNDCRFLHGSPLALGHKSRKAPRAPIVIHKKSNKTKVRVWEGITLKEVAEAVGCPVDDVIVALVELKSDEAEADENTALTNGIVISQLLLQFGYAPIFVTKPASSPADAVDESCSGDDDVYPRPPPDPAICKPRPPVVTIMGHVDHGKTTLLDALRHSQIVDSEFGGITQHIGAFSELPVSKRRITFLDTPGHAAFHAMRARGARATDLVVLVVAADDGVMEQTLESVRFAREADVPIIVAINKIDKGNADIERTKQTLSQNGIYIEEMGGTTQAVPISALKGQNLDELQEAILAEAEILELKADYEGLVEGVVVESRTRQGLGKTTTVLVQRGTLKVGDVLVAGNAWCKVRKMRDEHGKSVKEAPPSTPVEVIGWRSDLPSAGDVLLQVENEATANRVVRHRSSLALLERGREGEAQNERVRQELHEQYLEKREKLYAMGFRSGFVEPGAVVNHVDLSKKYAARLDVLIKGDVAGSVEAILNVLETYDSELCHLEIVNFGVGPVTESDVDLAMPFKGVIYAFNTTVPRDVAAKAAQVGVEIRSTNIIYRLVEDLVKELNSRLPETDVEEVTGEGHVIHEFEFKERKKKRFVAGCRVESGLISKQDRVRFIRDGRVIYDGPIVSLQKEKEQVSSVPHNNDAGIRVEDASISFNVGDDVVSYRMVKKKQTIDWSPPGF